MSKKKPFSGSTMTLKDFHGGSIPSDLPLPSAPGVSASPSNRVAFDRPMNGAWGMGGRMDHHQRPSRPGSAGGSSDSRGFIDDSVPFLPSSARIGRNFEEDERKPFDASFAPRRVATFDPDPLRHRQSGVVDLKQPQQQPALGRPGSSPAAVPYHLSGEQGLPVAWNGSPAPSFTESGGSFPSPTAPNAWGMRKDTSNVAPQQQSPSTFSGPVASAARFAQASAIDKISSGRWQSKPVYSGADVLDSPEMDVENARFNETNGAYGLSFSDQRHIQRINSMDSGHGGYDSYERVRSPVKMEVKEKNLTSGSDSGTGYLKISDERHYPTPVIPQYEVKSSGFSDEFQEGRFRNTQVSQIDERVDTLHINHQAQRSSVLPVNDRDEQLSGMGKVHLDGRSGGSHVQQQDPSEGLDRPKLKLLPRTKPLEPSERLNLVGDQGFKTHIVECAKDNISETHGKQVPNFNQGDGDDHGEKGTNQAVDRPKLNLKPRSRPLEQSVQSDERIRNSVFGGARPRELVLKDRGVEIDPNDVGLLSANSDSKIEVMKLDGKAETAASPRRHGEKGDGYSAGRRFGSERKELRTDHEKIDARKSYQRSDQRQSRENEKSQGGRPEAESWRKPVKETNTEVSGPSYGKVASAVQLAQVFSKSISDAQNGSQLISSKPSVPFSRLTVTDSRDIYSGPNSRKINGF